MKNKILFPILTALSLTAISFVVNSKPSLPQIDKIENPEAPRGSSVTFTGKNFLLPKDSFTVKLNGKETGVVCYADTYKLVYCLPDSIPLGSYIVTVWQKLNGKKTVVASAAPSMSLLIISEAGKLEPKITEVFPSYAYPKNKDFSIMGSGFSWRGPDNKLIITGLGEVPVVWIQPGEVQDSFLKHHPDTIHGEVLSNHQLRFSNISHDYTGHMTVMIQVGNNTSEPERINLLFYSKSVPLIIALIIFALIVALVYWVALKKVKRDTIGGRKLNAVEQLLIDTETDTLSLGKFQFFIWTAAALFGYLYLVLSKSLIQGNLEFVDIPDGLPGILLISASTSAFAVGITNIKGSKGSGVVHPAVSDLFTNGGVIAPEQFPVFLWTIVGALSFIHLVVSQKPENILDLPKVPDGFLQLMGVSSLGYLGGKLARKSGPIVDSVARDASDGLKITVYGRNLSASAGFQIGDEEIPSADFKVEKRTDSTDMDELSGDKSLYKVLHVKILNITDKWRKAHKLTIINPDGQKAEGRVKDKAHGNETVELKTTPEKKSKDI